MSDAVIRPPGASTRPDGRPRGPRRRTCMNPTAEPTYDDYVAPGSSPTVPPLRYLSARDVAAAMPALEERLELAGRTMRALVSDAELPPKIGVHPRPDGSFGHAMPAFLSGTEPDGSGDALGIKWVTGFGTNNARGLAAINAVVVINDASTGLPLAILDGGPITAQRTAAIS